MRLATCSYGEFRPGMGVPVRISLGSPKWWATPPPANVWEITPRGWYLNADDDTFTDAFVAQLDRYGPDRIHDRLTGIAARFDADPVLLCFERLDRPGTSCHRTLFAEWWLVTTGEPIPELGRTATGSPPRLSAPPLH